ncbi:protein SULFUR DEFICIENCY-INDUCED 1-like [Canna indica]|uniref:Protein SULFUR DEFICIENCY-INDUCED 1-like n=1 Tax=Canna indica TaxID=4628 RepID=A0AAQ3KP24_9LILI|nr:protein SULFUR DEFICIENCY-INDUCED 1-like [Canna indica]
MGGGGGSSKEKPFKIPTGRGPYVRAKQLQLVEKDLDGSILWFWKAINERDRVESALKDMVVVMKQQDRTEEAIEAIKSFRHLCSNQAQESLDNLLIDLYKKCGRVEEQIMMLKQKLRKIYTGKAFNGKTTKSARSHGKKCHVSIKQETARLLGNLGWAYMQQGNFIAAEAVYRKAQMIEPNANNGYNLSVCLIKEGHYDEARAVIIDVLNQGFSSETEGKALQRAGKLFAEIEHSLQVSHMSMRLGEEMLNSLDIFKEEEWASFKSKRLPVFEEISTFRDQMAL